MNIKNQGKVNKKVFMISLSMSLGSLCFTSQGMTPDEELLKGAQEGSLILIKGALKKGAQIEASCQEGYTALHWAAYNGRVECLLVLIQQGAQIEAKSRGGKAPLHCAASRGHLECLSLLIESRAKIDAKDIYGNTALHWAAGSGYPDCIEVLLKYGADFNAVSDIGKTPLHWASGEGNHECLVVLLKNRSLIQVKDSAGKTALHFAASNGHQECLRVLLENGAQLEAKDKQGNRALYNAAQWNHSECLKVLLLAECHVVVRGGRYSLPAPSNEKVEISRRRLKVALLGLRYAGSASDGAKLKNTAGDLVVSNHYVRPWFLLAHSGLREDVCIVLLDLFAKGKKIDYPLFRLAQNELGDYLITRMRDSLREITSSSNLTSVLDDQAAAGHLEISNLCNPDLVEENFGDVLRKAIKERFNELLRVTDFQATTSSHSSSSSQSTSSAKELINLTS